MTTVGLGSVVVREDIVSLSECRFDGGKYERT